VYKFLETPLSLLTQGLQQMDSHQQAIQYFKKLAKQLHPDKNQHPQSSEAFLKLKNAYDTI
jgi:DnaJ-class molecular chaperone